MGKFKPIYGLKRSFNDAMRYIFIIKTGGSKMGSRSLQIFFILFCFFCLLVFGQENQAENDNKLKKEILAVYKSAGEEGLRNLVKSKKDIIGNEFIIDLAKSAVKERNEEWLKISEIIAEEKKDEKTLADVLYNTGKYFRLISNNKKATDFFDKVLPIYLKLNDPVGLGNVYLEKGKIHLIIGENLKALEMYSKALLFFEKARELLGQGNVYYGKGDIYYYTGQNSKALQMYEKALPFFEEAGSLIGQGNVYHSKGNIYFYSGDNLSAMEMYNKALVFFERAGAILGQGNVYLRKGLIYFYTGYNQKAFEMFDKALPFFKKAGDPIGQGNIYLSRGDIYLRTGENSKALEMYDKTLPLFEKARTPIGQGNVYFRKGDIFSGIGENSKALEMYNNARTFFEKTGEPIGQGNVYWRSGVIYFRIGENSKALEMYDKALSFFERAGEHIGQGNVYKSKGDIYFYTNNNLRALEMYDKALVFFEKFGELLGQASIYLSRGDIYFRSGENSKALEMYDKALFFYKKSGAIDSESIVLNEKAKVLAKLGKKDEALDFFEKAIANLERVRSQTAFSEMKKTFLEKVYDQYEETVRFMLENKYYDKGLKYAESMRSRVFLDRMAEGLVKLDKGLTPDLIEKRDNLVAKLSLLSEQMHKTAGEEDEKKLQEFKEQYHKIEGEFGELLIKIRLNNPLYASVRYPQPVSVKELQENILETDELLLRYFICSDNIYVFLVSKKDFNVITLDVNEKDINEIVSEYLFSVVEKNSRRVRKYSRQLYRQLFKPLESAIKNKKEIIIIPDGQLAKIPFESLVMDDQRLREPVYLLEKYRVKYIQSASILAILREHYQRDSVTKHFIGFGDPVYDYENFEKGKPEIGTPSTLSQDAISGIHRSRYEQEGGIFTRLASSGEEVNAIANLFKSQSQKCMVHLRKDANETNAKSPDLKEFDYIHFACHAVLGDGFQGLVLSQLPQSTEDGYLTLNEIMNCDYNAKLVVLSACQTGKGKMEKGEGVTGLTQAVMYAGTPAVVASLWNVEDIATRELMVKFYKYLLEENLSKEDALRKAKLDLIKTKRYSSPFYWSAFVMYGE